jgi:ribosomal protein S18 acetylase RimI-like enzyme
MVEITRLKEANQQYVADINTLLPQLRENSDEHRATLEELQQITSDANVALIVAKDGERIVGMATLYMITKFSKRTGHIEDVVVDDGYRGQGLGRAIMEQVIQTAREEGVRAVHLTSRPERVAGNTLYQKLGFKRKETNAYTLKL